MKSLLNRLYFLHILNDGFRASILLFLPFIAKDLNINLTAVGLLGTTMNMVEVFLALPAGYIALRIGGIKLLLIALFLYGLGYFGVSIAPVYLLLLPAFLLTGVGFAIFHPVAFALVAKLSDKSVRGELMGNFTAIGDIGRIGISSIVTFLIVRIGWRFTSFIHSLIALSVFFILYKFLFSKKVFIEAKNKEMNNIKLSQFIKNKRFVLSTVAASLDSFASSNLFIFLPFLLLKKGVDPAILGTFTAAFFVGNFMGKSLLGRLVDKYGNSFIFIISELCMALLILILAISTSFLIIIITSIILGIFTKGTVPVIQTMISESVEHQGNYEKAFGLNSVIVGIATGLAPVTLGFFSDKYGIVTAFIISATFALLAIIPALAYKFSRDES